MTYMKEEYDELQRDRDDWKRIAESRMQEIRRLRQVVRNMERGEQDGE